jgi:hypothetical protein
MEKNLMNKKGQIGLNNASAVIITLVVIGAVGAVGVLIVTELGTSLTGDAALVIGNITETILNFFALMPVLGTVLAAVILLSAVVGIAFLVNRNR